MLINIIRYVFHILLTTRRPLYKYLKSIASNYKNLDILEIGSGDTTLNQSAEPIFHNASSFIQTDINNEYFISRNVWKVYSLFKWMDLNKVKI